MFKNIVHGPNRTSPTFDKSKPEPTHKPSPYTIIPRCSSIQPKLSDNDLHLIADKILAGVKDEDISVEITKDDLSPAKLVAAKKILRQLGYETKLITMIDNPASLIVNLV